MTLIIKENDQQLLKDALRCYRDKEVSVGNDVRDIKDLLDKILAEIKKVDSPQDEPIQSKANPKGEYIKKITG